MRRVLLLMLAVVLAVAVTVPAGAEKVKDPVIVSNYREGQFEDIKDTDWYYPSVKIVYEYGLMQGSSSNRFNPQGNITIAEAIVLASRFYSIYNNDGYDFVQGTPWYDTYVQYAISNKIITPQEFHNYSQNATRAQFAKLIASAVPEDVLNPINNIPDNSIPDVKMSDNYSKEIYLLYRAGLLVGYDEYGTFTPDTSVSRSAAATIISRVFKPELRQVFSLEYGPNSNEEVVEDEEPITTIQGLENYLNANLSFCKTPIGNYSLKFSVEENSYSFNGWDIEIKTEGDYSILPWADISSSIKYTDTEKEKTLNIFKNLQIEIYEIASEAFPDKKLTGCYFSDWYKYPSLNVGYETSRHLTWTNYSSDGYAHDYASTYITSFHWDNWRDD